MTRYCNNPEPMYGGTCLISNIDNSTGMEEVKEVICAAQGYFFKSIDDRITYCSFLLLYNLFYKMVVGVIILVSGQHVQSLVENIR